MLPDPGCYEERYRLTGRAALGLAAGLLSVGLGILWHTPVIFTANRCGHRSHDSAATPSLIISTASLISSGVAYGTCA